MPALVRSGVLAAAAALIAVAGTGPAVAATSRSTGATAPAVQDCGAGPAVTRPASMVLACADDGELAEHLHWSSWTATRATATGVVAWKACVRLCADSKAWDTTAADITLTTPTREPGNKTLFTGLDLHVTGPTPRGFRRDLVFNEAPLTSALPRSPAHHLLAPQSPLPFAAPSGTLGYGQIEGYWVYAGGPSGSTAQTAAAITGAESSFQPGIIQPGVDYCGSGSDRAGWGLWQITCGNEVPQYGTDFQLLDPWNNAEAAVSLYDSRGFEPWTTYDDGAYTSYLQSTSPDLAISDPGQYVQINATPSGTPASPAADPGSTYGPPFPTSSQNLLSNGSFEESATGWSRFIPSGVSVNMTRYEVGDGAPATAHDGSWYLAANTNGAGGSVYQDVPYPVTAGSSYVATAWLSAQSTTATGSLCLYDLGANGNCTNYSVTAGTYTKVQVVLDATTAESTLRFQIYPTDNGLTTDIDTASLVPSILPNGSFEESATGWSRFIPSGVSVNVTRYEVGDGAPATAHDGSWYLAVNTNGAGGSVYQDVPYPVTAGSSYVATAWLSAQSTTATGSLCLYDLGANGNCTNYSVTAGTYTEIQVVLDATTAESTLRFQIYPSPDGGTTDIDTASI